MKFLINLIFIFLSIGTTYSQYCDSIVPTSIVDLTASPNMSWVSPPLTRDGNCCGTTPPDECLEFVITLNPNTIAINFEISSGAVPPGALFYQIDCGPQTQVGDPICLTGVGPHTLTFCKPGGNTNEFTITSYSDPFAGPNNCNGELFAYYYDESSIVWTSISPGNSGDYDYLLSCTIGCDTSYVVQPSPVPLIDYLVCGDNIAGCNLTPICDTITLSFLSTTIYDTICNGDTYTFADGTTQQLNSSITYYSQLTTLGGCDSLVTENISILPTYNVIIDTTICSGSNLTLQDGTQINNITNPITYNTNLQSIYGCDSIITTNISLYNNPQITINGVVNGCSPLTTTISTTTLGLDWNWVIQGPDATFNYYNGQTLIDTFTMSGQYSVELNITTLNGCYITSQIEEFTVYPTPMSNFTWSPTEGTDLYNVIYFENNSTTTGNSTYLWDLGDGTTSNFYFVTNQYQDTGYYDVSLTVTNQFGCSDISNNIIVINPEFFMFVPNTFTPDDDPFNPNFIPIISGHDEQSYELLIFNRWGEVLFESHDINVGWDGKYNNTICKSDTYIWKITISKYNGYPSIYIGHVNLLK
jgi:gliding motility-associated-like protein